MIIKFASHRLSLEACVVGSSRQIGSAPTARRSPAQRDQQDGSGQQVQDHHQIEAVDRTEIVETDYGFEAETIVTVKNPPIAANISGTTEPYTKRHMRNKWFMPFCRRLDMEYPSGIRHIIFNCATPIADGKIQVVQLLFRNDTEADCSTQELIDWDAAIIAEDRDILESTDPDAIVDMGRRIEKHMPSDRPGC